MAWHGNTFRITGSFLRGINKCKCSNKFVDGVSMVTYLQCILCQVLDVSASSLRSRQLISDPQFTTTRVILLDRRKQDTMKTHLGSSPNVVQCPHAFRFIICRATVDLAQAKTCYGCQPSVCGGKDCWVDTCLWQGIGCYSLGNVYQRWCNQRLLV